ncbi:MAG: hypothetical protein ABSA41_16015 [Terriglobia bacterium]
MNVAGQFSPPLRFVPPRRPGAGVLSPIESLSAAWRETLRLLLRPFNGRRWIMLSVVCMFLGGGTSTAAFQWGFSTLPFDVNPAQILLRLRLIIAEHLSLIVLAVTLILGLVLALVYARCVLRFVLVDAVIKQDVALGPAWRNLQPFGRAYFFWLLGVLSTLLLMASAVALLSFPHLSSARAESRPSWLASLLLVTALAMVVLVGLLAAVVITLTDDLVVPLIYAERISFPAAWGKVWKVARRDMGTFVFYVALRFVVSIGISVAVLFFLFPVLMGLSSGAIIAAALVILALRVVGFAWVWNPVTMLLGVVALLLLTGLLFILLSVAGMPGQVYLQNYGVRFIASRAPSLEALCRASSASGRRQ